MCDCCGLHDRVGLVLLMPLLLRFTKTPEYCSRLERIARRSRVLRKLYGGCCVCCMSCYRDCSFCGVVEVDIPVFHLMICSTAVLTAMAT